VRELSDKIARYIAGEFEYEGGSLVFSCSKIEWNLSLGENVTDSFTIKEESDKEFHARIYSSNVVMQCEKEEYEGREVTVTYTVDIADKVAGDVIKGEFQIVSDMGEYVIPYVISIRHESMESSLGNIKNVFHFANLAKTDWTEAVKLFYHKDFISILNGNDARYRNLYRGLTVKGDKNRNVDEFLIGVNKKKAMDFSVDKPVLKIMNPSDMVPQTVHITRNGWGYLGIRVQKDGDFIVLSKEKLSDDDFLGNKCEFDFYIKEDALHAGNNFGRIRFVHGYGYLDVEIQVVCRPDKRTIHISHQEKRMMYALTRYYLDFRTKLLSASKWLTQTKEILNHRRNIDADGIDNCLFEAHVLLTQEHYNEAKFLLDGAIDNPEQLEDTRYCYYLYLTCLYNGDEYYSQQIADKITAIYKKQPDNWRIGWLLLYLPGDYNRSVSTKWNFVLHLIQQGCHSPIMYLEALMLLNKEPSLLIHLQDATLRILLFGAKMQYLSEELINQTVSIVARTKEYNAAILKVLKSLYDKKPTQEMLRVICMQLMKGECCDKESFIWYERGIRENLPLTKLYENYMMSMDIRREQEILKNALMYFSYRCSLPGEHTEYLYHYVVKNREEMGDLYEAYAPQIGRFVIKQLYAGRINANLAYLYQEILLKEMATPDNIRQFAEIVFYNRIRVADDDITGIVVLDERLKEETVYPVTDRCAYVQLFSNEHTILLEDALGNRYFGTREYQTECYFFPRRFVPLLSEHAKDSIAFNLFVCGDNSNLMAVTGKNADRCRYLVNCGALEEEYRKQIRMSLLTHYYEQDDKIHLEEMLSVTDISDVPAKSRGEVVKYLSIYGMNEKAYCFTLAIGPENVSAKTIVRFATGLIEENVRTGDAGFTCMVYSAFERGKYNQEVLEYLVRHYKGLSKNLRNVWRAAASFDLDTHEVAERLLLQILETGAYIGDEKDIYHSYVESGAKTDVNRAYLSFKSYEYLIHDRVVGEFIFEAVEQLYGRNRTIPFVCMLAYLKYYSDKTQRLTQDQQKMAVAFLDFLYTQKNIVMPFFADYKMISPKARESADNVMVEYRGNPNSTVVIHYIINKPNEEENNYIREEMRNMYGGIFVKEILLFYGESLQYYVTESYGNMEQLTESGTIGKEEEFTSALAGRYALINDIALSVSLEDYSTARELFGEYEQKEFMMKELFTLQ